MKIIMGIVLSVLLGSMLSATSSMAATSDVFILETDKATYVRGEDVKINFTNSGDETIYFVWYPPFTISDAQGVVVAAGELPMTTALPPGESLNWTWDQMNDYLIPPELVPAGNYTVTVEVHNSTWGLIAIPSTSFKIVPRADANHDGYVNVLDLGLLSDAWLAESGDPNYNPDVDFNMDDVINILDLGILSDDWLQGC